MTRLQLLPRFTNLKLRVYGVLRQHAYKEPREPTNIMASADKVGTCRTSLNLLKAYLGTGPVDDTVCHILLWTIFRRYRRRAYDISGQPYNENVGANEAAH